MTIFSERDTWKSLSNTATKERDELKAKLEKAKEALKKYAGGRSQQWRIVDNGEEAREAMKQIGE